MNSIQNSSTFVNTSTPSVNPLSAHSNPQTVAFLNECGTLLPCWAELRPTLEQLPLHVIIKVVKSGVQYGCSDAAIAEGLRSAVAFQSQDRWRCGACYRWLDKPYTPVACLIDDSIQFVAVCKRCDRRYETDEQIQAAIAGYVGVEVPK